MSGDKLHREEIVSVVEVPVNPIRCPKCGNGTITLHGYLQRSYISWQENGVFVRDEVDPAEKLTHEIEAIECYSCGIRFLVTSREIYDLQQTVLMLHGQVASATGQSKPC